MRKKNCRITRVFAALLAVLTLLPLIACGEPADNAGENNADTSPADVILSETTAETEVDLLADLPTGNYNGEEFRVLNNISNFALTALTSEELTGEPINDAIYNRNSRVAENLNIKIVEELVGYSEVTSTMNTSITAGEDAYDAFWNESKFMTPFEERGQLVEVSGLTKINLDKPWWNSFANDSLSIANTKYLLVGDLHLMFKESFWIIGFNKNIIDANSLEDPYQLVNDGRWTLEKMNEMMTTAAQDLNGDGQMTGDDQFGVTCYDGSALPLLIGAGVKISEKNEDGIPVFTLDSEAFYDRYMKVLQCVYVNTDVVCMDGKTQDIAKYTDGWHGVFSSGHALFYFEPIGSLKKLRNMDAEFGVLPYPKFDETQDKYYSYIAPYAAVMGVPVTNAELERTSVILENLCAESYGELRSAYSTTTLNFKYIRDKESAEMLELIFDTGSFELAAIFEWASLTGNIQSNLSKANENATSTLVKFANAANKALTKSINAITGKS